MKKCVSAILFFIISFSALFSQNVFEYSVHVIGNGNAVLPNVKVWLEEMNTHQKIWKYTDRMGNAVFYPPAGSWSLNLEGLPDYKEFDLQEGVRGQGSVTVFYDLAEIRAEQEIRDKRKQIYLTPVKQERKTPYMPPADSCIIKVKLLNASDRPVPGIPVDVVSVKYAFIISKNTNKSGQADFIVPVGDRYSVDVDGVKNFSLTRLLPKSGIITVSLEYEPTLITETIVNDTVTQQITPETRATSSRSLFELTVLEQGAGLLTNENVYLHEIGSNRVFKAKTDLNGKVVFLIPNGSKYLLHFDYARDVDVYNFTTVRGRGNTEAQIIYRPDPRLKNPENFIPAPDELFYTEFQNFITKQLPEPEEKVGIFSGWGNSRVNASSRHAVLDIGISVTSDVEKVREVTGVNLSFVIDRSGSMAGYYRIEALKESMLKFLGKLKTFDKVSLITFNTDAFVDFPMKELGNGQEMISFVQEIEPGGGTNIYNGMVLGYEELLKNYEEKKVNRLILLTDGYGETEPQIVVDKSKEYNAKGIGISAIGVGENYNSALLQLLTMESGGLMEHAGLSNDIYEAFEKQLSDLIFPVAREVKLTIKYNSKIKFKHLFGLPLTSDKNDLATFEIGNLFMGQNKIALAQFDLDKPTKEIEEMPVIIELSYYDLADEKYVTYTQEARLTWSDEDPKLDLILEQETKKLYAIAILNQSMKVMADAFAEEDIPRARYTIERAFEQINDLYPNAKEEDVNKLVAHMANYSVALDNYERKKRIEQNK